MYIFYVFFKSCVFFAFLTIFEKVFLGFFYIWSFLTIFEIWTVKKSKWSVYHVGYIIGDGISKKLLGPFARVEHTWYWLRLKVTNISNK